MDSTKLLRVLLDASDAEVQAAVKDTSFTRLCNRPLPNGQYPLHAVARKGSAKAVTALLRAGVNPNQESEEPGQSLGFTAAHYAAVADAVPVLRVLHEHGANLNHPAADQWTPLHVATYRGQSAAMEALIGMGADIDCAAAGGETPLAFAAHLGRVKDVRFLLKNKASIQLTDAHKDSLLHYALHYRLAKEVKGQYRLPDSQLDVAVLLVLNGVRPDEQNDDGDAPTTFAAQVLPALPRALELLFDDAIQLLCAPIELNYLTLVAAPPSFLAEKVGLEAAQAQALADVLAALEKERLASRPNAAAPAASPPSNAAPTAASSLPAGHPAVPADMLNAHGGDPSNGQCPFLARAARQQANKRAATVAAAEAEDGPHCPFSVYTMRRRKGTILLVVSAFLLGYSWGRQHAAS